MEENIIRINQMLLSTDKEMRMLAKEALKHFPSIKNEWAKMLVYFNSGGIYTSVGKRLFFSKKKTLKNYDKLLDMFEKYGYSIDVDHILDDIDRDFKRTKKLAGILKEDTRLEEFRKRTQPINNYITSWLDD